jgi:predicted nucleic acid-binding protein
MIVADSGPIIAFARVRRLDLLQQVVGELVIPEAVYEDLVVKGRGRPGATEVERSAWIHRKVITNRAAVSLLPPYLHLGEREAIVLAQEIGAQLLIDERRGRKNAAEQGLEIFGSLRILAEAKRLGFIGQVKPILEAMLGSGYWIDEELIPPFLQEIGEVDT